MTLPADPIDDLCARLLLRTLPVDGGTAPAMNHWNLTGGDSALHAEAAAALQRLRDGYLRQIEQQAREIAGQQLTIDALRKGWSDAQTERAERAERNLAAEERGQDNLRRVIADREAERDALRECVRDMLECVNPLLPLVSATTRAKFINVRDAARAKVKE